MVLCTGLLEMCTLSLVVLLPFQAARSHSCNSQNIYLSAVLFNFPSIHCSFQSHVSGLLLIIIMNDIYSVFQLYRLLLPQ